MAQLYYVGIGNRYGVPDSVIAQMKSIATKCAVDGIVLRSGGAIGSDTFFEQACDAVGGEKEIFKAKDCTDLAMYTAKNFHPAWSACNDYAKKLHGRNAMIILGRDLLPWEHAKFLVCFAADEEKGGTALGIKIARHNNIPVYNLAKPDAYELFEKFYELNKL